MASVLGGVVATAVLAAVLGLIGRRGRVLDPCAGCPLRQPEASGERGRVVASACCRVEGSAEDE